MVYLDREIAGNYNHAALGRYMAVQQMEPGPSGQTPSRLWKRVRQELRQYGRDAALQASQAQEGVIETF
jgi:hypothetical protein